MENDSKEVRLPDADFSHWSKAAHWTFDEAMALLFGKDPQQAQPWRMEQASRMGDLVAQQYMRLRELAMRDPEMGYSDWGYSSRDGHGLVLPKTAAAWARRVAHALPMPLERALSGADRGEEEPKHQQVSVPPSPRESDETRDDVLTSTARTGGQASGAVRRENRAANMAAAVQMREQYRKEGKPESSIVSLVTRKLGIGKSTVRSYLSEYDKKR
jgi:hypothetical protein